MTRIEQLEKRIQVVKDKIRSILTSEEERENLYYELMDLSCELAEKKEYDNLESMGIEY